MHRRSGTTGRESGQVLILFALSLVAIMAVAALAVDGTIVLWERTLMQNAADAASEAGTYRLADNFDGSGFCRKGTCLTVASVRASADALAQANGLAATRTTQLAFVGANQALLNPQPGAGAAVPEEARGVRATVSQSFASNFGGVIGIPQLSAGATATGIFGVPQGMSVFPLVIGGDAAPLPNGVSFNFHPSLSGGSCNATCVNFEMLATLPSYPTAPPVVNVTIGTPITTVGPPAEPGSTVSNTTRNYVNAMVAADSTGSTCSSYVVPNPRIVYIPYVNPNFNGPPETMDPLGFRAFMFTSATSSQLNGCWVNVNAAGGTLTTTGPYTGVTMMKLIPTP